MIARLVILGRDPAGCQTLKKSDNVTAVPLAEVEGGHVPMANADPILQIPGQRARAIAIEEAGEWRRRRIGAGFARLHGVAA